MDTSKCCPFRKVGFRLVSSSVFEIDCKNLILLVFYCRIPNYFLVYFALLSFVDSLTYVWFHLFRSLFRLFFQLSLYEQQLGNFSLLLLESYRPSGGVFCENFLKFPTLYMDICLPVCGGVFRKFLKISSTYIGKFSSLC